ncbi:MAG: acyl-CoA dehydrogenase family protein [Hyphomicrobiales bacterium]|nr:acyl-CoA dehydrogenase family protein [Hyphomicrobiales bacterium]
MSEPFETHEVFNQSPAFADVELFDADLPLREAARREGAGETADLSEFGRLLGTAQILEEGRIANVCAPTLHAFDASGNRRDRIEFHPAYHAFMRRSTTQGLHSAAWEHLLTGKAPAPSRFVRRLAGIYMMSEVEPGHLCPITMTHACVAPLIAEKRLSEASVWLPKILSRAYDPAFKPMAEKQGVTIGMGMTEKQGGTDVRANTTKAEPAGEGEYRLTGHKWFMSAPMCDAFLMLAQAPGGLSCFFVPRFRPDGKINAIRLIRLKDKLGNRSNASCEVELAGAHGFLVGEEGRGVATIIEMVTLTRLDCAASSAGLMRWGLANALHHARHRSVFQKRLADQPMMQSVLADMALDVEAAVALAFRLGRAFDRAGKDEQEAAYARFMTPITKYWCCKITPRLACEAMECMGGNGYVEEAPLARLYREAPLNAIWEGSGNVMCLDMLRAFDKDRAAADGVLAGLFEAAGGNMLITAALQQAGAILADAGRAETQARFAVEQIALAAASVLLKEAAPGEVADSFITARLGGSFSYTYGAFGGSFGGAGSAEARAILKRALPE